MNANRSSGARSRSSGDIIAAAILASGAAIERARGHRAWLAAVPIIGVNAVAFYGQLAYWQHSLQSPLAIQVLIAAVLEAIAVYLAWQAHLAQLADDAALRLRLSSYGMALVIGTLNYSHWMRPGWRPSTAAVVFGMCSVISPWLWAIHSRRESRDALKARGLIEDHGVRLGATRWFWHPVRCIRVTSRAAWTGENRPAMAITLIAKDTGTEDGHDTRAAVAREAMAKTPPPAAQPREPPQGPRRAVPVRRAPVRAARAGELAAASDRSALTALEDSQIARDLIRAGTRLPGIQKLAGQRKIGAPRARRILALAAAQMNGNGPGDHDGAGD